MSKKCVLGMGTHYPSLVTVKKNLYRKIKLLPLQSDLSGSINQHCNEKNIPTIKQEKKQ